MSNLVEWVDRVRECVVPGRPMYVTAVEREVARLTAPPMKLQGQFDMSADAGGEGVTRLNSVLRLIKYIPMRMPALLYQPLQKQQQRIADRFIDGCLPNIVTPKEWVANRPLFLRMRRLQKHTRFVGVIGPRQMGKSWTVAVCCAAIMMSCPGVKIGCYATTQNQASVIQDYVVQIFKQMGWKINQRQSDNMCWVQHSTSSASTLTSFGLNAYVPRHYPARMSLHSPEFIDWGPSRMSCFLSVRVCYIGRRGPQIRRCRLA